jgi:purine-nucleoside phosphorylase
MIDLEFKYKNLLEFIKSNSPFTPIISVILGSGLGEFASSIKITKSINTIDIPQYPASTVTGHSGKIHFAEIENKKVLLFQGRIHFYEGYSIDECILPALISKHLGCKYLLVTNAAGGINKSFKPGDLMLISSAIGLNIKNDLTKLFGLVSVEKKNNFLDFPSEDFNKLVKRSATQSGLDLKDGVYWYNKGPVYETPAEVRMAQKLGADAVGMSTIPEAVFANVSGLKVGAVSCITNYAAGISPSKLNHSEVTETASKVAAGFAKLVTKIISNIE